MTNIFRRHILNNWNLILKIFISKKIYFHFRLILMNEFSGHRVEFRSLYEEEKTCIQDT